MFSGQSRSAAACFGFSWRPPLRSIESWPRHYGVASATRPAIGVPRPTRRAGHRVGEGTSGRRVTRLRVLVESRSSKPEAPLHRAVARHENNGGWMSRAVLLSRSGCSRYGAGDETTTTIYTTRASLRNPAVTPTRPSAPPLSPSARLLGTSTEALMRVIELVSQM